MTTRSDRLRAILLAILLAVGAGVVWGFVAGWTLRTVDALVFRSPRVYEHLSALRDGTPLVSSYSIPDPAMSYRTLDGKRVNVDSSQTEQGQSLRRPTPLRGRFARLPWNQRITPFYRTSSGSEIWYLVHDGNLQGHAHLVGYDRSTKLRVGYVGRHGFRNDLPPPEDQFPLNGLLYRVSGHLGTYGDILSYVYVLTDEGIVRIDLDARKVKIVWKETDPISVAFLHEHVADDATPIEPTILVRTPDRVRVLDIDGREKKAFPLPAELRDAGQVQWMPLPGGKALAWGGGWGDTDLFWLDASGVVRHEKVSLERGGGESTAKKSVMTSLIAPVPAGFAVVMAVAPLFLYPDEAGYWTGVAKVLADAWPSLLTAIAISIVLACLCYRRQRKYGLPWTPAWTVLVLLLGLPLFLGYLAHRQWPARLPCPNCGRPAPRDRPGCFACRQEFPAPALKGVEVFA